MREFLSYLHVLSRAIAWCWSSGRINFAKGVFFFVLAQLFRTAALFLPIKILLMLASGGSSRYTRWIPLDHDVVLVLMVCAIPVFYVVSILCASGHRHVVDAARPSPQPFFQTSPTRKRFVALYENCLASMANATIIFVAVGIAFLLNWVLGLSILALALAYTLFVVFALLNKPYGHVSWGKLRSTQIMEYSNVMVFFAAFLVIAGLVITDRLDVYAAVLCLLMSRMMARSLKRILLTGHKNKILYISQFSHVHVM